MHSKNAPRAWLWCLRFGVSLVFGAWCLEFRADAQPTNSIFPIDLPTALQLAGAQNLDVRLVFETNAAVDSLVQRALSIRPDLKQSQALVEAARENKNGAVYGPLIPSI